MIVIENDRESGNQDIVVRYNHSHAKHSKFCEVMIRGHIHQEWRYSSPLPVSATRDGTALMPTANIDCHEYDIFYCLLQGDMLMVDRIGTWEVTYNHTDGWALLICAPLQGGNA